MPIEDLLSRIDYKETPTDMESAKQQIDQGNQWEVEKLDKMIKDKGGAITHDQRYILQNIFDTDKGRRAAYLKQLGYEMNPEDDNQYKPIGSGEDWKEIDPGFGAYFKKGGLAEVGRDIIDAGYDLGVTGTLVGSGAAFGAAAGAASSVGALTIPAAVLGAAAGSVLSNQIKEGIGTMLLESNVPPDQQAKLISVAFDSMAPVIGKAMGKGFGALKKLNIADRMKAVVRASKAAGGQLDEALLRRAMENPEMFSEEAVNGASKALRNEYRALFGVEEGVGKITDPSKIAPDSLFGQKLMPIVAQRDAEIAKLAKDPINNFTVDEIGSPLKSFVKSMEDKKFLDIDEEAALKYAKSKLEDVQKAAGKNGSINFQEATDLVKRIQQDAYSKQGPGSSLVRQMVGGGEGQMNAILKSKASPNFIDYQAQISNLLDVHEKAAREITPAKMTTAFLGADSPSKQVVKENFALLDDTLGTNLTQSVQDKTMQRTVENLYEKGGTFGSGGQKAGALSEAKQGAMKGAVKGAATGAAAGGALGAPLIGGAVGGTVGGIAGGVSAYQNAIEFSNPQKAMQELVQLGRQSDALEQLSKGLGQDFTKATPNVLPGPLNRPALLGAPAAQLKQRLTDLVGSGQMSPEEAQKAQSEFEKRLMEYEMQQQFTPAKQGQ